MNKRFSDNRLWDQNRMADVSQSSVPAQMGQSTGRFQPRLKRRTAEGEEVSSTDSMTILLLWVTGPCREYPFLKVDSARHSVIILATGLPDSCFHWRDARLHG